MKVLKGQNSKQASLEQCETELANYSVCVCVWSEQEKAITFCLSIRGQRKERSGEKWKKISHCKVDTLPVSKSLAGTVSHLLEGVLGLLQKPS